MRFKLQNAVSRLPVVSVCSGLLLTLILISSPKSAAPQPTLTLINPEQITELSGGAEMRITRLVSSAAGLLAVAETGRSAELIRYDGNGNEQGRLPVSSIYAGLLRGVTQDQLGNVALLFRDRNARTAVSLDSSSNVTGIVPINHAIQSIVLVGQQLYALSDTFIIRVSDGAVMGQLPQGVRFELVSVRDEKIVAIDTFSPQIYTIDPRNRNVEDTYVLHAPELTTAMQSSVRTASATSMLIYTAAVDARGMIYGAISPYPSDSATILKFDEFGSVLGTLHLALLPAKNNQGRPASAPNMIVSLIGVSGDGRALFVYSQPHNMMARYQISN